MTEKKTDSRFIIIDDRNATVESTEKTMELALKFVDDTFSEDEFQHIVILEFIGAYEIQATKASAVKMKIDEYRW